MRSVIRIPQGEVKDDGGSMTEKREYKTDRQDVKAVIRTAERQDVPVILEFIRDLAVYEMLEDQVVATEELLTEWMFEKQTAEALLLEENGTPVGYALFFHNFSTFLGRAGIYLEDLFVKPKYRGKGYGKALFERVAEIACTRGCGRLEWSCLDWNVPSIEFYRSMKAEPMEEWTVYRLAGEKLRQMASKGMDKT